MARLIFSHAEILDAGTTDSKSPAETIYGITVDGLELTKEPTTVEIEDGRQLYESYTGSITIRTVNEKFGQDQSSASAADIIDSTNISSGGSVTSAKQKLKLFGVGSSPNVEMDNVYIMAHKDFANGRLEIVLSATAESTNQTVLTTS